MGKLPLVSQLPKPVVIEGGKQRKPSNFGLGSILTQEEYASAVIALVNEAENESEDNGKIQGLSSALRRLLLSRCDPPLPLYWTLVAVEKSLWLDRTSKDPLEFGTSILNFAGRAFGSLKSLSAVNASGRTALSSIAPIVGLLYDVASLLSSTVGSLDEIQENNGNVGDNGKKARKLLRKLKEVVKNVLGFICLSHCKDLKAFERSFSLPPAPQTPLESFPDFLHPPLPLASKKSKALSSELSNSAVVADIVSGEVVILQLVVETLDRRILLKKRNTDFSVGQAEFVQRLKNLSVCSVWDASSPSPSEMLLDVLLEKRLPVLDLLAAKEEVLLRGVLFEILLLDAPLFSLSDEESDSSLSALDHYSVLFMKKLSVARRAVAFFRSQQERSRLTSLLTQVTDWQVPRQLLKWLKSQKKQRLPAIALQDQQTLINWLVNTAEKSVFAALLEESVATWSFGPTSVGTAEPVEVVDVENGDAPSDGEGEDLFFVDTAGETELANDSSAADLDFTAAAQAMRGESDKMKKKKKKQSQVLFHRHEQSSGGTKRARIEVDDVHITSTSGSDSEASAENRSKSAQKKSKHKAVDIPATSEEGEVEDGGGALASAQLSGEEHSSPVKSGEFSKQQQTGHYPAQTEELAGLGSKEHTVGVGNKELTDGGGAEELLSQPEKEMVITPVPTSDVDVRKCLTTQVEPVLPTEGKSARKKKKSKDPEDPGMEASADLCTPQRTEELAGRVGTEELTSVVGTEELPPQPNEEIIITSVSANEMNIRDSLTTSQVDLVPPSVGKSAKKKKSKNSEDPAIEAPAELHPPKRTEEVAGGVGTEELNSAVGTEELPSRPGKEMVITSISANEVDARDSFTTSQVDLVPPSVGKSAKKKKSKNSEDPAIEAPAELHPPKRTEEVAGGVGTEELNSAVGTEELPSRPGKEMAITSISANEVDARDSFTTSQVDLVPPSVGKSAKKKKSKNSEDPAIEAPAELHPPKRTEEVAGGVGTAELNSAVGTEELPSRPGKEMAITSISANEVDARDSFTTSQVNLVPPSVGKSAKKKKSKNSEDPAIEAAAELHPPKRTEEVAGGVGTEELNSAVGNEELPSRPGKEMAITSISANEVDARDSFTTSQVNLVPPSVGKSAKKKKSKNSEDPFMEAPAELHLPQRTEEVAGGVGTEQLNSAVGTEELPSQPDKGMVIASVSADGVDTRDSLTTSLSVGKSAKKKKKPKDLGDQNMEALAELYPVLRTEEVAGGVGTEELPSQPGEQMVITSVSANELGTRDSWTNSQGDLVPLSVGKSAKKKKKSKDPEDAVVEAPAELDPPHRTEERAGGVGTEELTIAVGTKDLPSHPAEEMVIITSVPANEVDTRYCLTNSQVDIVTLSVGKSAKKKKSKDSGDAAMEAPVDVVDRSKDGSLLASTAETKTFDGDPEADTEGTGDALGNKNTELSKTMGDVETRADIQGEEVEDVVHKAATTSCEELEVRRSSSPLPILTPQTVGTDDLGGIGDITGVVQSPSLRDGQEEIPVVKSSRKKRTKEHRREGEEGNQHNFFDTIKEELVTASANISSADLIDALQVEESLPADKQLSRKTKTPRSKRARLGQQGNNTGDVVGTVTIESANTVSALNSDKTRSSNEATDDGKVSEGDVAKTAEEALLSASLMQEILGNRQTEDADGRTHGESEENISVAVVRQVNPQVDIVVSGGAATGPQDTGGPLGKCTKSPIKNVVEEVELGTKGTPSKQNSDGTGTSGSRRRRLKSKTDVGLATVAEERVQPKEEVFEEAPIAPSPSKMVEGGQGQGELEVSTPNTEVHSSDVEVVTSVKPSSRKRKTKPEVSQLSGGSDTTEELLYQRRTRSGRALGTPPPTPTRRTRQANMRRKLMLEPLEEEK
ncbi:unnamed protein product [Calypogeia fissa]